MTKRLAKIEPEKYFLFPFQALKGDQTRKPHRSRGGNNFS
jgi:hypothetical protein